MNLNKFLSLIKAHQIISAIAGIILATIVIISISGSKNTSAQLITAERKTLTQEVVVTGKTKPLTSVNLGFERSGKIIIADTAVGQTVVRGQILAQLDASELLASRAEAEASLQDQQAKLAELQTGARPEEIQIYQTKTVQAETGLVDGRQNLIQKIYDVYAKSDDAVRNKADQLFSNPQSSNPQLSYLLVADSQTKSDLELGRQITENSLKSVNNLLADLSTAGDLGNIVNLARQNLNQITLFLTNLGSAINSASAKNPAQTALAGWKTDIATARISVNAASDNLTAAYEKFNGAESNLVIVRQELNLKQAGPTANQLTAQKASVAQAQARLDNAKVQLAKTVLRSPINGVITKQDAKIGQIAGANDPLVSIIAPSDLEIEAHIPEVDIGAIKIGNPVNVTFDAFSNEKFYGAVAFIDPAETIVDGVVNFKIIITLKSKDDRLKSGLTSNLAIQTLSKNDVLTLPQFAILENDTGTFVRVIKNKSAQNIPVRLGMRGADGYVEILSGLADLEQVVNIGAKK